MLNAHRRRWHTIPTTATSPALWASRTPYAAVVDYARDHATALEVISRERIWKLVSTGTGLLGGLLARKLLRTGYTAFRHDAAAASPFDSTTARFSWPDVVLWGATAGIGLGIAKVVSARVALIGWQAATGSGPPGVVDNRVDKRAVI